MTGYHTILGLHRYESVYSITITRESRRVIIDVKGSSDGLNPAHVSF